MNKNRYKTLDCGCCVDTRENYYCEMHITVFNKRLGRNVEEVITHCDNDDECRNRALAEVLLKDRLISEFNINPLFEEGEE